MFHAEKWNYRAFKELFPTWKVFCETFFVSGVGKKNLGNLINLFEKSWGFGYVLKNKASFVKMNENVVAFNRRFSWKLCIRSTCNRYCSSSNYSNIRHSVILQLGTMNPTESSRTSSFTSCYNLQHFIFTSAICLLSFLCRMKLLILAN